jgi:hypothetical protein
MFSRPCIFTASSEEKKLRKDDGVKKPKLLSNKILKTRIKTLKKIKDR